MMAFVVLALVSWAGLSTVRAITNVSTAGPSHRSATSPSTHAPTTRDRTVTRDGSLGNAATRQACTLLNPEQISAAFGGRDVSPPFATYPFCQWFIGHDAFLALSIQPATRIGAVRGATSVVQEASGIGSDAFFGSNRYLYFGVGDTTYWLLYQRVGEFTGIRDIELEGLAHHVLAVAGTPPEAAKPPVVHPTLPPEPAPSLPVGTPADPLRVWFAGDSLAAGPSWAFFELTKDDHAMQVTPEYQVGTGLVREDYFDWIRHAAGVMAALNPDVAVYMGGGNDNQELQIDGTYHAVGDPAWNREFRGRIGEMMDVLTQSGRHVIWVGMPPMQNPTLDHGMRAVDAAYEAEAKERPLVTYVDAYQLFGGEGGAGYTDSMRFHAEVQVVRLTDGIHLNGVGSTVAADAILKALHALPTQ